MALNAVALAPEVLYPVPNVNDGAEHVLFARGAADAWSRGEDPLDFWVPQTELGFPQFAYYQHLPHLVVVLIGRLLFDFVDLRTIFDVVRYLLLVGFPLTVFWAMRRMGFSDVAAAIGAAAGSLLSGSHRYGFEYDSYVWRGLGVYPQLFAMHLSFVALATLHRLATRGTGVIAAALACAALALSDLTYAYMAALTAVVLVLFGMTRANAAGRLRAFAVVGVIAGAIASYVWVPFLSHAAYLNASTYLEAWKYDSFGAPVILGWLLSGDLLDHGRIPLLSALLAAGAVAALVTRARLLLLSLLLFGLWLILYFGRPTLGQLADLFPLGEGLLFHRFIGQVDLFAILLIGAGGGWLWDLARATASGGRLVVATAATALLLVPALTERWSYLAENATWMRVTQAAIDADHDARTVLDAVRAQPPGRVYAGLESNWGQGLDFAIPFNSVHLYNLLTHHGFDALAPLYRRASLNADLLFHFNDQDLAHYRLFNVSYVIAPPSARFPPQLRVLATTSRYVLYAAPGGGYAEYATIARSEPAPTQADLLESGRAWLLGDEPSRWTFVRYEYRSAPADGPASVMPCASGQIAYERVQPARFDLLARCTSASALVLKVSYHPNWRVTVDGREATTFMVSPSFLGLVLPAGEHFISAEYRSSSYKAQLLALGTLVLLICLAYTFRPRPRVPLLHAPEPSDRALIPASGAPALVVDPTGTTGAEAATLSTGATAAQRPSGAEGATGPGHPVSQRRPRGPLARGD